LMATRTNAHESLQQAPMDAIIWPQGGSEMDIRPRASMMGLTRR
jgi:hypothetical protein